MSTIIQRQREFDFVLPEDFEVTRIHLSSPAPTCSCGTILATEDEVFSEECDACFATDVESAIIKETKS